MIKNGESKKEKKSVCSCRLVSAEATQCKINVNLLNTNYYKFILLSLNKT